MSVTDEPVSHRPARTRYSPPGGRLYAGVDGSTTAALPAATATQRGLERPPELEGHDVIQYWIDNGTDVVENTG